MIRMYIGLAIVALLGAIYYKYSTMESRVQEQAIMLQNKELALQIQAENIQVLENEKVILVKKAIVETEAKVKVKELEKETQYDKSNSRLLSSTRIDLP